MYLKELRELFCDNFRNRLTKFRSINSLANRQLLPHFLGYFSKEQTMAIAYVKLNLKKVN